MTPRVRSKSLTTIKINDIELDSINFDSYILECPICYEIKEDRFYGKCSHSWCKDCHSKMYKYHTCPICRTPYKKPPLENEEIWVGHDILMTTSSVNGITRENILSIDSVRNRTRTRTRTRTRNIGVIRSMSQTRERLRNRVNSRRNMICSCIIS